MSNSKGKRKSKNWLSTFLDWTKPVSEAPESLLIWSGLFCLSAVMKRNLRFSKEYLKKYDIYPTSYIMFVGPPGVVRKSTSAGYAQEILSKHNVNINSSVDPSHVTFGPTSGSSIGIMQAMAETFDGSLTVIAGEFGNIVSSSPEETYDFFAKLFDTDATAAKYVHQTRQHKRESILNPSLNLLGCTTPDWIAENSGYMLGGGFAARTVFIFENRARARHLFYKGVGPSVEGLAKLEEILIHDLALIGKLEGEFKPEDDKLAAQMEAWYLDYIDRPAERGAETFQARKHIHTLRTAMLLSACERDDLIVTKQHFDAALVLIDDVESKLSRGLSAVGRNPYSSSIYTVLEYIAANGTQGVDKGAMIRYFYADIPLDEMDKILTVLKASGEIEEVVIKNDRILRKT